VLRTAGAAVALSAVSAAEGSDVVSFSYTFDVPPGETRTVMTFATGQPTRAAAAAQAQRLLTLPATVVSCMTVEEVSQLVNFTFPDCNENLVNDADEADSDGDGVIDGCDNQPETPNPDGQDSDGDDVPDFDDNAPDTPNPGQADGDDDGVGDVIDNAPSTPNADQADGDGDGVGDAADNAPNVANADQADADGDRVGDVIDNCLVAANTDQADSDGDGVGNACEPNPACAACGPVGMASYAFFISMYGAVLHRRRRR
jgi:hypothetical protein